MKEIAFVLLLTLGAMASDVSGKWTGTFTVPGSDHKEPQLFLLQQDGKKLTGSGGPDAVEQYPIKNGTVDGGLVSFELSSGNWTFTYSLKRSGQEMNGELKLKSTEGDSRTAHVALRKVDPAAAVGTLHPEPQDAVRAIAQTFDRFPIVAIGEAHSLKEVGDFYASLVKDPGVQARVNDIVIEFGTRLSQSILDRYINGEEVAPADLKEVWRNTTKVFAFESPVYAQLLAVIREVNRGLPPARRIRVLAGDSPIDWNKVTTHEQWKSYQPNDLSFAGVIDEQVLAHRRKALLIMGGSHVSKNSDPARDPNTTTLVERKHPGTVYVVLLDEGGRGSESKSKPPSLVPTVGPHEAGDFGDALLYLGENLTWAQPDWQQYSTDSAYLKELDRRARIEWGCGFDLKRFMNGQLPCP
jgi:hypothetical protein